MPEILAGSGERSVMAHPNLVYGRTSVAAVAVRNSCAFGSRFEQGLRSAFAVASDVREFLLSMGIFFSPFPRCEAPGWSGSSTCFSGCPGILQVRESEPGAVQRASAESVGTKGCSRWHGSCEGESSTPMKTSSFAQLAGTHLQSFRALWRLVPAFGFAALLWATSSSLLAQAPAGGTDDPNARRRRGGPQEDTGGRNFDPAEMQARMLTALRERFEVTDDEEWKVISDRISKLNEIRRSAAGGAFGGFGGRGPGGGPPGGGGDTGGRASRVGRGGGSSNPEVAALTAAIQEKLPDAEIKSRLDRVREQRKENESKLTKAQENLRALLSVRQEAVAVLAGLLP